MLAEQSTKLNVATAAAQTPSARRRRKEEAQQVLAGEEKPPALSPMGRGRPAGYGQLS